MKEKYIDEYGIDSLKNLKEAVACGMDAFMTLNEGMLKDRKELEKKFRIKIISPNECKHKWEIDKRFEDGSCIMLFGKVGEVKREMRYVCKLCGSVKYVK